MCVNTIAALKNDDRLMFEHLFHQSYERVYFYLLKKTRSEYLAEEATQLTFIKLWQYRKNLDEEISFDTQLFRIVRTTMIDLLRKQKIKKIHTENITQKATSNDVWENVMLHELKGRLVISMQQMPPVRRKVFELSRFKGLSNKEIASHLSISVKAVEFHITKALRYLKQVLPVFIFLLLQG